MSAGTCNQCRHFNLIEVGKGECRRFPPTMRYLVNPKTGEVLAKINFVPVAIGWSCGEFAIALAVLK